MRWRRRILCRMAGADAQIRGSTHSCKNENPGIRLYGLPVMQHAEDLCLCNPENMYSCIFGDPQDRGRGGPMVFGACPSRATERRPEAAAQGRPRKFDMWGRSSWPCGRPMRSARPAGGRGGELMAKTPWFLVDPRVAEIGRCADDSGKTAPPCVLWSRCWGGSGHASKPCWRWLCGRSAAHR